MPETLTVNTPIENLPEIEPIPRRMSCECASLFVKIFGAMALTTTTLGATGDLVSALFVGVGYSTTLVCVSVLPVDRIPTPKVRLKPRATHQ